MTQKYVTKQRNEMMHMSYSSRPEVFRKKDVLKNFPNFVFLIVITKTSIFLLGIALSPNKFFLYFI